MNLLTFLVSGTLVSLLIWFVQRGGWNLWARILCILTTLAALAIFIFLQAGPPTLGGEQHWYETSPYLEMLFFALMLLGMSARYITKAIEVRREKIAALAKNGAASAKPGLEFDFWEFSYPLFVSVVTYGALLSQLKDHSLSIANATLSFQTGFFWQTVLAAKQQGKP